MISATKQRRVAQKKAACMPKRVDWTKPNSARLLVPMVMMVIRIAVPMEPAMERMVLLAAPPWAMRLLSREFMPQVVMGMKDHRHAQGTEGIDSHQGVEAKRFVTEDEEHRAERHDGQAG